MAWWFTVLAALADASSLFSIHHRWLTAPCNLNFLLAPLGICTHVQIHTYMYIYIHINSQVFRAIQRVYGCRTEPGCTAHMVQAMTFRILTKAHR